MAFRVTDNETGGVATFEVEVENDGDVCLEVIVDEPDAVAPCGPFTLQPGETEISGSGAEYVPLRNTTPNPAP